jgi:hypothetical protein
MPRKTASEKPAKTVRKREEPKVTMTIIRLRREDHPVEYAQFCAHVKELINGIIRKREQADLLKAKNDEMCTEGDQGVTCDSKTL